MKWQSGATAVCLVTMLGCSTTSTIRRANGPEVEGDIVGGSRDSIFVDAGAAREYEIPRDDVTSIDYPGNVHRNVGAGFLVYGALNIAAGLPECQERTENQGAYCAGVFTPAVVGLGMLIWGLVVERGQKNGVDDMSRPSRPKEPPKSAP